MAAGARQGRAELAGTGRSSPAPGGALRRVEGSELALLSLEGGGDLRCAERDDAFLRLVSAGTQNGSLVWVIRWSTISDKQHCEGLILDLGALFDHLLETV